MFKVVALMIALVFVAMPVKSEDHAALSASVELMNLCKNDAMQCELVVQLAKDNILFAYKLGSAAGDKWQRDLAALMAVSSYSCIEAVTPGQLRSVINEMYGSLDAASNGAGTMLFNSLAVAAADNCAPIEV